MDFSTVNWDETTNIYVVVGSYKANPDDFDNTDSKVMECVVTKNENYDESSDIDPNPYVNITIDGKPLNITSLDIDEDLLPDFDGAGSVVLNDNGVDKTFYVEFTIYTGDNPMIEITFVDGDDLTDDESTEDVLENAPSYYQDGWYDCYLQD